MPQPPRFTTIEVPAPGGTIPVQTAGDPTASAVIVVLHQAGGLGPQIDDVLTTLADAGYYAVAPDLFYRRGDGPIPLPADPADLPAFDAWLSGDAVLAGDLAALRAALHERGFADDRIGVVGYSYGGRVAYLAATLWALGAVAVYYAPGVQDRSFQGNDDLPSLAEAPTLSPWIGFFGERDHFLQPGELDRLAGTAAARGAELVRYPTAGHSFDADVDDAFGGRDDAAAADAQRRLLVFFGERLGGGR